ncbi:MAG: lactoylglutathione lyase [Alphaproteobacteria bacterium CG_4_10_14_0_8_um_filter_53_9]|nr:MAG: lactoylglutathione lyase [Alphaproteobacteria bacterium CG_4_10_14_0_8_um_filter_53_9]
MISHVTIGVNDVARARFFYDAVLAPLGYVCLELCEGALGYGVPEGERPELWVMMPFDGRPAANGNGWHVAFLAPSRAAVDTFFKAAMLAGGSDEGAPALRPHYGSTYYAAYVRDLEGNKVQAVCREVE